MAQIQELWRRHDDDDVLGGCCSCISSLCLVELERRMISPGDRLQRLTGVHHSSDQNPISEVGEQILQQT